MSLRKLDETCEKLDQALGTITKHGRMLARIQLALEVSGVGMWEWTPATNDLVWDERMCQLFDEVLDEEKDYQTFFQKLVPEDRERVQAAVNATLEHGVPYEIDYTIVWKDGSRHKIHARGKRWPAKGPTKKLIGVCIKIHDRPDPASGMTG